MQKHFLLFCSVLLLCPLTAQVNPFEPDIRAFERADSLARPAKGQILLYGSSTMVMWRTFREDLAGFPVVNRGFGGSEMSDAIYFFDRVVLPLEPSWILLYEGDNDLNNSGKSPEQVYADFKTFMTLVQQKLPNTKVAVFSLRPSLAREHLMPQQRKVNALFKKYCRKHPKNAYFIDLYATLLTPEGKPNGDYLLDDKLHLNAKGYAVWARATRDFLQKHYPK